MNVLVLAGSLRSGSTNRTLARIAVDLLPDGVSGEVRDDLSALPFYSEELDTAVALPQVQELRDAIDAADAVLVATPEYNGSLPGVLKNALDWASRPRGGAALAGKPAAVIAASMSPRGAQWAREDAVKVLRVAGAEPLEATVGVGSAHSAFADGRLIDSEIEAALRTLLAELAGAPVAA